MDEDVEDFELCRMKKESIVIKEEQKYKDKNCILKQKRWISMKAGRRGILTAAILGGALLLSGCGDKLGEEDTREVNTLEAVHLTVEEEAIKSTEITYTITNNSEKDLTYGRDYSLQIEKDGKWYQVIPKQEIAITMDLLWVPAGSTESVVVNWEYSYGKLSEGHYRITKPIWDNEQGYLLAGEFSISK